MYPVLLWSVGSFSEHLDPLPSRDEGIDSPDSSSKTPMDLGGQHGGLQPDGHGDKHGGVAKVSKSVSANALSLMIPGGERTHTHTTPVISSISI